MSVWRSLSQTIDLCEESVICGWLRFWSGRTRDGEGSDGDCVGCDGALDASRAVID